MKLKSLIPAVFAALILPNALLAGPAIPTFTFDENGNGFLGSTPVAYTTSISVTVSNPQGNGTMTVNPLVYYIGAALQNAGLLASGASPVAGDWRVTDPGAGPSDLLRWTNTGLLYVFSQPGGGQKADVGVPFTGAGLFFLEYTFPDGSEGVKHTSELQPNNGYPNGEPGYIPGNITYKFISEGTAVVPEPSTLVLATLGAAGLAGYRTRRKMARATIPSA